MHYFIGNINRNKSVGAKRKGNHELEEETVEMSSGGRGPEGRAWFNFQELHGKASRKAKVTVEGRGVRTFDDAKPNKDFYDIFKLSGWAFKGFNSSSLSGFSKSWGYRSRSSSEPGIDGDPPRSTIVRRSPSSAALSSTLNKRTPRKIYFLGFSKEMQKIRYNF